MPLVTGTTFGNSFTNQVVGGTYLKQPTLLPDFDQDTVTQEIATATPSGGGDNLTMDLRLNPAQFLVTYPRVSATMTITVAGTPATGETISTVFTNPVLLGYQDGGYNNLGADTVTITAVSAASDTVSNFAEKVANAINNNAELSFFGVWATNVLGVVTVNWPGPVGNFTTATASVAPTGGATVTAGNSGVFAGGSGPVVPYNNFQFTFGYGTVNYRRGQPQNIGYDQVYQLVNQGAYIV